MNRREFLGELIGVFLLVLFGCGSVGAAVLFGAHASLFQVAILWGVGVTLAIYATRHLSCAHLNPAVSLAMTLAGRMSIRRLPSYVTAQMIGAFLAAALLYGLYADSIAAFESLHGIVRGAPESVRTAMMFGEYYPNPGMGESVRASLALAATAEGVGTFLLVLLIFFLTEGCNVGRPDESLSPIFIGLAVASIICLIAPLTQAGLNPARDLAPRLFAWLAGWGDAAFPDQRGGFLLVYVLGPLVGAAVAAGLFVRFLEPAMVQGPAGSGCHCNDAGCGE